MSRILQRFAADGGHGRIISSILVISFIVVAMIGAFAFIGPGDYAEVSSETKETSGECGLYGDNLLWSIDDNGNLTITGSGPMKDFSITHDIRWGGNTVRTVAFDIVEGGTTTIGEWAFAYCTSLVSVDFESPLSSIGYAAFMGCTNLKSFSIPDGVESIDEYAFCYCSGPTEFVIPDSVTAIRNYAFFNLTTIETITFGKGITTFDEKAFSSGTTIDSAVGTKFFDENGIQIDFSDTSVFREKKFTGSIRTMSLAPGTFIWDGIIYKASESAGEAYVDGYNSAISDATILGSVSIEGAQRKVVSIRDGAFEGCTDLASVKIPDEVQSMGTYTFKDCNNLESVTLGNSLKSIGTETFKGCTGLTSVTFGSSLDNIGEYAFEGCTSLSFVSIPDSVTSISSYAFFNCTSFKGIHFGTNISSIDSTAFSSGESYEECVSTKFYDENGDELNLSEDIVKFRGKMFTGGIHEMIITEPGRFVRDGIIYLISDSNPNEAYVSGCTSAVKSNPIILDTVPIDGVDRTVTYINLNSHAFLLPPDGGEGHSLGDGSWAGDSMPIAL